MHGYSRVLVTGGAGFIGSHVVDRLLTEDLDVVVLDNLQEGREENLNDHLGEDNFRFVHGDIRDVNLVRDLVKDVDIVIHHAALVSVPKSIENPVLTDDVNVRGTLNLLKASTDSDVKRFIHASSCAVYGETEGLPLKEDERLRPLSPYGVSKLAAEQYMRVFYEIFGLETICLRYFNAYGPRQVQSECSGVITHFLRNLRENRSMVIFGDGKQTRDFVHVRDIVEANVLTLERNDIAGETFNIATGVPTTINKLAKILIEVTRKNVKLVHSELRKGDIKHSYADVSKAKKKLQYTPKISLKEGLENLSKNCGIIT